MPTDTSDQQITRPVDADVADNPVAFINALADMENRLVRRYTDLADRTARMLTLAENAISTLATENRVEVYDGANHISLYTRSLFAWAYKNSNQTMTLSSTTLQDVGSLLVAMPTAGVFSFRGTVYYDTSTTADIKFGFTFPAGGAMRWTGLGVTTAGGATGDGTFSTVTTSGGSTSYGGAGVGTVLACHFTGEYVAGGTAGNVQFQAAQNVAEATNTTINIRSHFEFWRVS
jgi:hypothetical protein